MLLCPGIGMLLVTVMGGMSPARTRRVVLQGVWIYAAAGVVVVAGRVVGQPDSWGTAAAGFLVVTFLYAFAGGRRMLAPPGLATAS